MKRLLVILAIGATLAVSAQAQHRFGHHRHHGHHGYYGAGWGGWVAPLIIGGVVGAAVANNRAEAQTPPPVIVQPTPVIVNLPPAPFGFHYEQMLDGRCNCYKWVLVAD
jgi:hypothetical protein